MLNFDAMLTYVKNVLIDTNTDRPSNPLHQFRSRGTHIERVYKWCQRIVVDCPDCNKDILYTAAIFHDIGYSKGKKDHAHSSAIMFLEYAKENNMDYEFMMEVARIISLHSDKSLLEDESSTIELILLLEADLLDEEGALGICWDLLSKGKANPESYMDSFEEMKKHSGHILSQDYMVTPIAKKYWDEKKELVRSFIKAMESDLFVNEV